jgi:hypothetical protein
MPSARRLIVRFWYSTDGIVSTSTVDPTDAVAAALYLISCSKAATDYDYVHHRLVPTCCCLIFIIITLHISSVSRYLADEQIDKSFVLCYPLLRVQCCGYCMWIQRTKWLQSTVIHLVDGFRSPECIDSLIAL